MRSLISLCQGSKESKYAGWTQVDIFDLLPRLVEVA
jgi:hypothetical protein